MSPNQLTPGDLIRYDATTTRWYLAVVRQVNGQSVQVEFFWGATEDVDLAKVTRFRNYLATRQRKLSLKRKDLSTAFFNNPLHRLRKERLHRMQETLQQHGLAFKPKQWPTPDTRVIIWRDESVVLNDKPDKDTKFEALLPRWLEALKLPPSSRDPLGFQAHAERLANELLPGLTVFTSRIGYYGLLTWAIQLVNDQPLPTGQTRLERLHRLERTLVLCEFVHHGMGDNSCPLLGQRSKTQILQSAEDDRFRVPKRIFKYQVSAGAYRLYFSSLKSLGFAQDASDLGAEDRLPLTLTDLGERVGRAFELRLDSNFSHFSLSDGPLDRDTIRSWGKRLCFSQLGEQGRYREPFLDGLLLGNSHDAAKRYQTVRQLFQHGLLTGSYQEALDESGTDIVAEEDARNAEEIPAVAGLGNARVLLHFYEQAPQADNRHFQVAAIFELLALGLSALFQAIVEELRKVGRTRPAELATRIAGEPQLSQWWILPLDTRSARPPKVRTLVQRLFATDDPLRRASLGGVLLIRVLGDRLLVAIGEDLAGTPVLTLSDSLRSKPGRTLAEAFPDLVGAMVARHQAVSTNKNRQRWCYLDGDAVVKDDLKEMRIGLHAFRFPQLFSICRDLGLREEDLRHAD